MTVKAHWKTASERNEFYISIATKYLSGGVLMSELAETYERKIPTISKYVSNGVALLAKQFGIYENEAAYKENGYTKKDIDAISLKHGIDREIVIGVFEKNQIHEATTKSFHNSDGKLWDSMDVRAEFLKNLSILYVTNKKYTVKSLAEKYDKRKVRIRQLLGEGMYRILIDCGLDLGSLEHDGTGYITTSMLQDMSEEGGYDIELLTKILKKLDIAVHESMILPHMGMDKYLIDYSHVRTRTKALTAEYEKVMASLNDGKIYNDHSKKLIPVVAIIRVTKDAYYAVCIKSGGYIIAKIFFDIWGMAHIKLYERRKYKVTEKSRKKFGTMEIIDHCVQDYIKEVAPHRYHNSFGYIMLMEKRDENEPETSVERD